MHNDKHGRVEKLHVKPAWAGLPLALMVAGAIVLASCGSSDPDTEFAKDVDQVRDAVGSVFLPTYLPDGYRLQGASVNDNPVLKRQGGQTFEASVSYASGSTGEGGELDGYFFIHQFPEGWNGDSHIPAFKEITIDGLAVRRVIGMHEPEYPAFYFQADGRWLWISVQVVSDTTIDRDELARIAKSVRQFSGPVDWGTVAGVTERG